MSKSSSFKNRNNILNSKNSNSDSVHELNSVHELITNKVQEKRQKKDIIVAVRMPKGLVEELKDLQRINHFMDLSDEIRFIIRKNLFYVDKKNNDESRRKENIIDNLNKIIRELKSDQ